MSKAVVVGAGPNGLAAAITLQEAGHQVTLVERAATIGGGARTAEVTLPGFHHDICSAVHPMGIASPFLGRLPLHRYGVEWIHPDLPYAHPMDDPDATVGIHKDPARSTGLGDDLEAWVRTFAPLVRHAEGLIADALAPLRPPRHPFVMARFGLSALRSGVGFAERRFDGASARAAFAGIAGHSILPLDLKATAAAGLVLGMLAHHVGWPVPKGGSQALADALAAHFEAEGGTIETGKEIRRLEDIPDRTTADAVVFDLTPKQVAEIVGAELPGRTARRFGKYRYGPGVCKVDYALDGPVPWRDDACRKAGTVHVGGTIDEIADSERAAWEGRDHPAPFLVTAQPSLFDDARAPPGKHTFWAYAHVPNGSTHDASAAIDAQIERFAPGFKDRIIGRRVQTAMDLQAYNPNYVGGDINGGAQTLSQMWSRPRGLIDPYRIPKTRYWICSSATPPGGGVHGLCGHHAARSVLRRLG